MQKPRKGVLKNEYSENMHQIYRNTPMPKCDFNKVACNFTEITRRHGCSSLNLLHIFRTSFPQNTSGGLLLFVINSCFFKHFFIGRIVWNPFFNRCWPVLDKIRRVVRFFLNVLNDIIWFVVKSKGAVVKAQCHVQIVCNS